MVTGKKIKNIQFHLIIVSVVAGMSLIHALILIMVILVVSKAAKNANLYPSNSNTSNCITQTLQLIDCQR